MNTAQQEVAPRSETTPAAERPRRVYSPRVDVRETPDAFEVTADVPGVSMDAIDVTVEDNRLELYAKRTETAHEGFRPAYRQYGEGDYRRAFTIPEDIQRDQIRADLREGVLHVILPKAEPVKPKKVQVRLGGRA